MANKILSRYLLHTLCISYIYLDEVLPENSMVTLSHHCLDFYPAWGMWKSCHRPRVRQWVSKTTIWFSSNNGRRWLLTIDYQCLKKIKPCLKFDNSISIRTQTMWTTLLILWESLYPPDLDVMCGCFNSHSLKAFTASSLSAGSSPSSALAFLMLAASNVHS